MCTPKSVVTQSLCATLCAASLALVASAQNQPKKNLTARQLFYAAVQTAPEAPKTETAKADTPQSAPKTAPRPARPAKTVEVARPDNRPPAPRPGTADGGQVINASSNATKAGPDASA